MQSDDREAIITALHVVARPADMFEVAVLADVAPFQARAHLEQLLSDKHVAKVGEHAYQLTARGYADLVYHQAEVAA